jgi:hypothetical protein
MKPKLTGRTLENMIIRFVQLKLNLYGSKKTGPCKVRNETETKHNETKRHKMCKLRNETKQNM